MYFPFAFLLRTPHALRRQKRCCLKPVEPWRICHFFLNQYMNSSSNCLYYDLPLSINLKILKSSNEINIYNSISENQE